MKEKKYNEVVVIGSCGLNFSHEIQTWHKPGDVVIIKVSNGRLMSSFVPKKLLLMFSGTELLSRRCLERGFSHSSKTISGKT